jgi:hypothetical protein
MLSTQFRPAGWRALTVGALAGVLALSWPSPARAGPINGTLFFTTFSGGNNVHKATFSYNAGTSSFALGSVVDIAATPGADGITFTSDHQLAVGGQGNAVYKVNPITGTFSTVTAGGTAAFHMMVAPDGTIYSSGIPGTPASYPGNLGANGVAHPLSGADRAIDTIIWATSDPKHAVYTASGPGGFGNIGFLDLNTFTTTQVATGVPAAHGGTYDPFTNTIILFGDSHITQFDPTTLAVISNLTIPGETFDQGTVDGKGHVFVCSNNGDFTFLDISGSGLVGSPNFQHTQFLAGSLDDVAPLSGRNTTAAPEPSSVALLGMGALSLVGYGWRRRRRA